MKLLVEMKELIEIFNNFNLIYLLFIILDHVENTHDMTSCLLRGHVPRDTLQKQTMLMELTVTLIVAKVFFLIGSTFVKGGILASPETENTDVHDYGYQDCVEVRNH